MPRTSRRHTPRLRPHRRRTRASHASRASRVLRMQRGGNPSKTRKTGKTSKTRKTNLYGGTGVPGSFTKAPSKQLRTSDNPQVRSIDTSKSFQSQMKAILKTDRFEKGNTASHFKFIGSVRSSFKEIIQQMLSYANALQQNGFKIVRINTVTSRADASLVSSTVGTIRFSEYRTLETLTAKPTPLCACLWVHNPTPSAWSKHTTKDQMDSFQNDSTYDIVDMTDDSFTPFSQRFTRGFIEYGVNKMTKTQSKIYSEDKVHSVIWYYNKNK